MVAWRLDAQRARLQDFGDERLRVAPLHLRNARANRVTGQAASHEDDESVQARDAVSAVGEPVDRELELLVSGNRSGHSLSVAASVFDSVKVGLRARIQQQGPTWLLHEVEVANERAEYRLVLADVRSRIRTTIGRRIQPLSAQEIVFDELRVGVEAQGLVVDEALLAHTR